jgi:hypothetical protein
VLAMALRSRALMSLFYLSEHLKGHEGRARLRSADAIASFESLLGRPGSGHGENARGVR